MVRKHNVPVRIAEGNEPKLRGRVNDEVLGHSANMRHSQTRPHHELNDEVTVTHTIHAVLGDGVETELLGEEIAINREGVARQGTRAERQHGYPGYNLVEALEVCTEGKRM